MKKRALVTGLFCLLAAAAFAEGPDLESVLTAPAGIEKGLLVQLQGSDPSVVGNAAFLLGYRKCPQAVIPLMGILRTSESQSCRIAAALSLCLLGDARGTFAVRRAATFDPSPKVRTLCAWFYDQYVQKGSFAFVPQGETPENMALGRK